MRILYHPDTIEECELAYTILSSSCLGGFGLLYNFYVIEDVRYLTSSDSWVVPTLVN